MSTNRTLPTTPISAIPAGTDVRDLRNHLNRIIGTVNTLLLILRAVSQATRIPVVPPHNPAASVSPFEKIYLNGTEGTITGSYSAATPFLWWDQANNTAEWKANDMAPCPLDTKIRDGSKTGDSEWRDWR